VLGGFVLAAVALSLVVAWPGRRRWPWWLILGLSISLTVTVGLALALGPPRSWVEMLWIPSAIISLGFIALATFRDFRDPTRS
jgi:4-hydroxybenzoate polyprenyltransferase